ncbi:hypothetical protein FA13DRAFT_1738810 [Coprinellus micaceus]|uniref:Nephrocystin 3-like N-terminal domain-containing protein n=1 Tax=Coprinellus micaceus TaxID=71717 RepID=A0A4Y7STM0_COPMI|nr:hypothetical protein FA13DRAFT_1738810 [Coprinellus micaceus]
MSSTSSNDSLPPEGSTQFNLGGSFYASAHGFRIGQQNNIVNHHYGAADTDIVSSLRPIPDASYTRNRKLSPPDSTCLPGTRDEFIKKINVWADKNVFLSARHVMWIHGYVGCGKSSLSQAVAERYAEKERLLGSFFFFRGAGDRSSLVRFAATMACQLAAAIPETVPYIEKALRTHPGLLASCTVDVQFQRLIYDPLIKATRLDFRKSARLHNPYIIVLDGLDECDDREGIAMFIEHMLLFFKKNPRVPLRFFITSRVEEHLRTRLQSDQVYMLNLVDNTSFEDVAAVADATFALAAKHDRVIQAYGKNWPSPEDRRRLAEHADGSLIFMSAILKFVLGPSEDGLTPMQRLPLALDIDAGLDGFYTQTLSRSESLPHFFDIIATMMLFLEPPSVLEIANAICVPSFEVVRVLVNLHAILQVPGDNETPVTICHTSLRDFLDSEERSGRFYVSTALRDRVYGRIFARGEDNPHFFDIIVTILFSEEPLSVLQVADLAAVQVSDVSKALSSLAPIFRPPSGDAPTIILPAPIRDFLRTESRSGRFFASQVYQERIAYACFELVSQPLCRPAAAYAHMYALDHLRSFLGTIPKEEGGAQRAAVLSKLRELFSTTIVDVVLAVLVAMDQASHGLPYPAWSMTMLGQALHSRVDPDHSKLVAAALQFLSPSNPYRPLTSVLPDVVSDLSRKASWDDVRSVVQTVFILATQNASPSLDPWNWRPVLSLLQSLFDLHEGSLLFACHLINFTLDLKREARRPPSIKGVSDDSIVDTTLDDLYFRVLAFSETLPHFDRIISTVSLLEVPFTICQLCDFLSIPISTIRDVLIRLRGVVHVPMDNITDVTFSSSLRHFLRDETRAGSFFAGPLSHADMARRCLEILGQGPRVGSSHPRSIAAYAHAYHFYHQKMSERILRRGTA